MISFGRVSVAACLLAAIAISVTGCSGTGNDESAGPVGTWVNASYDADSDRPGKIIVHPDYACEVYGTSTDPAPNDTGTYAIVEQAGSTYKTTFDSDSGGTIYSVVDITATTMVGQFSETGFPPQDDAQDMSYTRQ
jgi:hypothetical protein